MIQFVYTDEMKKFIEDNQKGISRKELTERFNEHFHTDRTVHYIQGYCDEHKLRNGRATKFKKGNVPMQHKEVGSERLNRDGYIEIKVKEPRTWKPKHNYIWEEHNGEIPKGSVVIFLDQDKMNFDISNLMLVTRGELMVMNQNKLFSTDPELTRSGAYLAKAIAATRRRKKRN